MSTTQSLTAVVTDIRKIEMRHYPVPEAGPTDAVLKSNCAVSAAAITTTTFMASIGPTGSHRKFSVMKSWVGSARSVLRLRAAGKSRKAIWSPSRRRSPANAVAIALRAMQLCARTSEVTG